MKLKTLYQPCLIESRHTALMLHRYATFACQPEVAGGVDNQASVVFQAEESVFATRVLVVIVGAP